MEYTKEKFIERLTDLENFVKENPKGLTMYGDGEFDALNRVKNLILFGVIKPFKTEKIQERINQLKKEKEVLMKVRPTTDGHSQHLRDQIKVKNNLIWEIENVLNVL